MTAWDPKRLLILGVVGLIIMAGSYGMTYALTPMDESEMRSIDGGDGADVTLRVLLNNGTTEGADGTIFLGGGAGDSLHQSGNEGFLAMGDIGTDFSWNSLEADVASSGNTGFINLHMADGDEFTGMAHIDQIGVTKSGTLGPSSVPANLIGDVTVSGPFDVDGTLKVFPN